jgi:transcriptional regulator with XRE-family HTH domain
MTNDKLRIARIKKHLSETEVCRAIGADLRTYQHWESGKHIPQAYYRKKLCELFELSLEELGYDPLTLLFTHASSAPLLPMAQRTDAVPETPTLTIPTDMLEIAMLALRLAQQERGWSQRQVQEYIMSNMQRPGNISRREFGLLLAGLPLAALAITEVPEELLPHCAANLTTAWKLARGVDLPLAQSIVSAYIPAITPLAEQPTAHQQEAAELTAKSYILNGLIEMHLGHLGGREKSCIQAVKYAEISGNADLITAARRWLACTYYYLNNPEMAMNEYQQAAKHLDKVAPLLRSSVLVESAVIQAQYQHKQEALASLGQAQETFFVEAGEDQNNLYTGHDVGVLTLWSGLTHYELGDYQKSLDTLLQIDGLQPKQPISERIRVQYLNQQALSAAKINDMEQATTYLQAAAIGAVELGSKVRFSEAKNTYQIMQFLWPGEPKVAALRPLFIKSLT